MSKTTKSLGTLHVHRLAACPHYELLQRFWQDYTHSWQWSIVDPNVFLCEIAQYRRRGYRIVWDCDKWGAPYE